MIGTIRLLDFGKLALYDALKVSESALKFLDDDVLKSIARELTEKVKTL